MSETKKANHQVNIVRLGDPRVHTNADTLELFDIAGYQVVTKKGQFKAGDLAVYIQPDSVVPQTEAFKFIWAEYLKRPEMCQHTGSSVKHDGKEMCLRCMATLINGETLVPERRRRITVRKFRKEWSEGLMMPLSDFFVFDGTGVAFTNGTSTMIQEGDDVSDLLNITHWEGDDVESTEGLSDSRPKRKYPKTLKGWFFFLLYKIGLKSARKQMIEELAFDVPKFDVENIKNYKSAIKPGEEVIVTEKIHGSQGRFFFREGKMYAGSRNFWKAENSPCVWRKVLRDNPWIEDYCRANEGNILYGEVVPTQKGYRYGCEEGQTNFFVFDIRNTDGNYLPKTVTLQTGEKVGPERMLNKVPVLYHGPYEFDGPWPDSFVDGPSQVPGTKTPREGIVITVVDPTRWERGIGRVQLKRVSNAFLEKDSK